MTAYLCKMFGIDPKERRSAMEYRSDDHDHTGSHGLGSAATMVTFSIGAGNTERPWKMSE